MKSIKQYWKQFSDTHNTSLTIPKAWKFGDGTKEMGNELAELVVKGRKKATCSAKCIHDIKNEAIPVEGQYNIVLNGENEPVCIIQYTKVSITPMNQVTEEFAALEGEDDLSYKYWYNEHERFFRKELGLLNIDFTSDIELVCQEFKVVDINRTVIQNRKGDE